MSPIELQVIGYFSDSDAARRALDTLHKDPRGARLEVVVRVQDKPHQTVPISLSHSRVALAKGLGIGGATGLLMGGVVGWAGYRFEGLEPSIIVAFGALGLGLGALGAALIGPINPHPLIERLEKGHGATLVVDADTPQDRAWAEQVLLDHGADIERKAPRLKEALAR